MIWVYFFCLILDAKEKGGPRASLYAPEGTVSEETLFLHQSFDVQRGGCGLASNASS